MGIPPEIAALGGIACLLLGIFIGRIPFRYNTPDHY